MSAQQFWQQVTGINVYVTSITDPGNTLTLT